MKNKLPKIKKDIKSFLMSEEGKIYKKDIAKVSMKILALGLGLAGAIKADSTHADCTHTSY